MQDNSLIESIKADLYRNCGELSLKEFFIHLFFSRSFKITFWLRLTAYASKKNCHLLKDILKYKYRKICRTYCVDIPYQTIIGKGLLIYHGFGIVINEKAILGNNITLSHDVTIGDEKGFSPIIQDKVIISPGAKIFGHITIGENAVIGANAVVNKDVPANSVSVGVPNHNLGRKNNDTSKRNYWEKNCS